MKTTAAGEHTKRLLTDSLKQRMAEKPLNRISIKEITDGCRMQRQTFYYHFEDIYDQIKWLYQQEFVSLMDEHEGTVSWQEELMKIFRYIEENRAMCLCTLHSIGREHLKQFIIKDMTHLAEKAVLESAGKNELEETYQNFLVQLYTIIFIGILENWLTGEMDRSPEELILLIHTAFEDIRRGSSGRYEVEAE